MPKENNLEQDNNFEETQDKLVNEENISNKLPSTYQVEEIINKVIDSEQDDRVHGNMNIEEDDDEVDVDLTQDQFININHNETFKALKDLLNSKSFGDMNRIILNGANSLEFGRRDKGATTKDSKFMSLNQRWFSKAEKKDLKEDKNDGIDEEKKDNFVERNRLVQMTCIQGRGRNRRETIEMYRVLAIFDKYYNKWFVSKDDKKIWHVNYPKGKYKILARKLIKNGSIYEEEDITDRNNLNISTIFVLSDACNILSVGSIFVESIL